MSSTTDVVRIFDTTLRDGEQSPGIALDAGEKLEIARQLARLGVDIIEAGFPISPAGRLRGASAPSASAVGPRRRGAGAHHARTSTPPWSAGGRRDAAHPHLHRDLRDPHGAQAADDPEQVLEAAARAVRPRQAVQRPTSSSPPRTRSRTDLDFMAEVVQRGGRRRRDDAQHPRHRRLRGPRGVRRVLRECTERVPEQRGRRVGPLPRRPGHGRRQLAGRRRGRRAPGRVHDQRHRRAGRQRLARGDRDGAAHPATAFGLDTGIGTTELVRTSRMVSRLTGYPVQYNKAVVGANAFAHESGIHQHGVLNERPTYEIMDAESVGLAESTSCWASTRAATPRRQLTMGFHDRGRRPERGVRAVQGARRPQEEDHLKDLVAIDPSRCGCRVQLPSWSRWPSRTRTSSSARGPGRVRLRGGDQTAEAEGDGIIDASSRPIDEMVAVPGHAAGPHDRRGLRRRGRAGRGRLVESAGRELRQPGHLHRHRRGVRRGLSAGVRTPDRRPNRSRSSPESDEIGATMTHTALSPSSPALRRRHRPRGDRRGGRVIDRRGELFGFRCARCTCRSAATRSTSAATVPVARARGRQGVRLGAARRRRRPALGDVPAATRAGAAGAPPRARHVREPAPGAPRRHRPDGRARADRRPVLRRARSWDDNAMDVCSYTREQVERISRWAFRLARRRSGRVVSVDKANVLATSKLWRRVVTELHEQEFPEMALTHELVDSFAMNLATRPEAYDVILTENMFGDILSDLAAAVGGGLASRRRRRSAPSRRASSSRCTARRRTSPARARRTRSRCSSSSA